MRWVLVGLVIVIGTVAVLLLITDGDDAALSRAEAEAQATKVAYACSAKPSKARGVRCTRKVDEWRCSVPDGRKIRVADEEHQEISVVC